MQSPHHRPFPPDNGSCQVDVRHTVPAHGCYSLSKTRGRPCRFPGRADAPFGSTKGLPPFRYPKFQPSDEHAPMGYVKSLRVVVLGNSEIAPSESAALAPRESEFVQNRTRPYQGLLLRHAVRARESTWNQPILFESEMEPLAGDRFLMAREH